MAGEERECMLLLRKIVGTQAFDTWICKVVDVSEVSCVVERVFDNLQIKNVRLNATVKSNDGLVIYPKKDSYVLVTTIDNEKYFVSQFSEIEKITLDVTEDIFVNGGKNEGLVKIKELTEKLNALVSDFNAFVDIYSSHTHAVSGASTGAPSVPATKTENFNQSYYENEKIKH
ncbi:MAG TPA: hypothetical protein PLL02_05250 [Bacteroidales bacterium]|nr:hypothetical protein [Bacteroidales bacterium]